MQNSRGGKNREDVVAISKSCGTRIRGNVDIRMLETCWLSLLPSVCVCVRVRACMCVSVCV
jgi:hypothetical protein